MTALQDFFGKYTVKTANLEVPTGWSYDGPSVQVGQEMSVGCNGNGGATVTVNGNPQSFDWSPDTMTLQRIYSVLATSSEPGSGQLPILTQISLISDENGTFKALYAATVAGDPQQVGVWGADNGGG